MKNDLVARGTIRRNSAGSTAWVVVAFILLAIISGVAVAILPWQFSAVVFVTPVAIVLAWKYPIWALLPYLCFSFFVPRNPLIDVLTAGFLLLLFAKLLATKALQAALVQMPAFFYITLLFGGFALTYGLAFQENMVRFVYRDARVFLYLLLAIPFAFFARTQNSRNQILHVLITFSLVVSVLSLIQAVLAIRIIQTGQVADLYNISSATLDTVRVQIPGFPVVLFAIIYCFSMVLDRPARWMLFVPISLVLFAGMAVNYGRGLWFWTAVGIFIVAVLYRLRGLMVFSLFAAITFAFFVIGNYLDLRQVVTITDRAISTFSEGGGSTSLGWRQSELTQGIAKLWETHGVGVGLGGEYREPLRSLGRWEDYTRYTHNTYLFLALKLSLLGLLAYLAFIFQVFRANLISLQKIHNRPTDSATFAFLLAFVGLGVTQPELMTHYGVILFSLVVALIVGTATPKSLDRRYAPPSRVPYTPPPKTSNA